MPRTSLLDCSGIASSSLTELLKISLYLPRQSVMNVVLRSERWLALGRFREEAAPNSKMEEGPFQSRKTFCAPSQILGQENPRLYDPAIPINGLISYSLNVFQHVHWRLAMYLAGWHRFPTGRLQGRARGVSCVQCTAASRDS